MQIHNRAPLGFRVPSMLMVFLCCLEIVGGGIRSHHIQAREFERIELGINGGGIRANDWVVQEATGRVFCSVADSDEVIEYAPDGEVRRFKLPGQPGELLIKGDLLVIGCPESTTLHFVDLTSNQVTKVAKLDGQGPFGLFGSKADDPYVYCICNTGDRNLNSQVFQIDTTTAKVRKTADMNRWRARKATHVAMSADGNSIVVDQRGKANPGGAYLLKVDAEACEFQPIKDHHADFFQIVAGPRNRFWTLGGRLHNHDTSEKVRSFSGLVCAIHPDYDLVAAHGIDGQVVFHRFSDSSELAVDETFVDEDAAANRNSVGRQTRPFDTTLQFDLKRNLLFVGQEEGGGWIDLTELGDKLSPSRVIVAPVEYTTTVNRRMMLPVSVTNSEAPSPASLVMLDGPTGAKLDGEYLVWTPDAEHVGSQYFDIAIQATDGSELDAMRIRVNVALPKTQLGFVAKEMELSPNGEILVVWGDPEPQESGQPNTTGPSPLAVISAKTGAIVVKKEMLRGIRDLVVDDNYIYIVPSLGSVVYRLSHKLDSSKRSFLQFAPESLHKISPDTLIVQGAQDRMERYSVRDMSVLEPVAPQLQALNRENSPGGGLTTTHRLSLVDGRLISRDSGNLLRIKQTPLPMLVNYRAPRSRARVLPFWGRELSPKGLLSNTLGNRIAQNNQIDTAILSEDVPLGIQVSTEYDNVSEAVSLSYVDVSDGAIEHTSVIRQVIRQGQQQESLQLLTARNIVVVGLDDEILFAQIPGAVLNSAKIPTHFLPKQATQVSVGKVEAIELMVGGSREGVTFSLVKEHAGTSLDKNTGIIQVDTNKLWTEFALRLGAQSARSARPFDQAANALLYQKTMGQTLPNTMAAAHLPLAATLRDAEGQQDKIEFCLVLTGPVKEIDDAINAAVAERREADEEKRLRQLAEQQAKEAARATAQAKNDFDQRLQDLESRMQRIEAALESVLKNINQTPPN